MKSICKYAKTVANDQRGMLLPMALVLMCIGALLIPPMLQFRATMLKIDTKMEESTKGMYAADAGIQDALWRFNNVENFTLDEEYPLGGKVNGMTVKVYKISSEDQSDGTIYTIKSTAMLDTIKIGEVVAQLKVSLDYTALMDNAIVTTGSVYLKPGDTISGTVQYGSDPGDTLDQNGASITGEIIRQEAKWPTFIQMKDFYSATIDKVADNWVKSTFNPSVDSQTGNGSEANPWIIPPLYRNGSLTITIPKDKWAKLTGTIYIISQLTIEGATDTGEQTLELDNHTVFSEYNSTGINDWAIDIKKFNLYGPGCVIARGDINFQPKANTNGEYILVMSIEGTTQFKPGGNFFGTVAGGVSVELLPGCSIMWQDPEGIPLDFPGIDETGGSSGSKVRVLNYAAN